MKIKKCFEKKIMKDEMGILITPEKSEFILIEEYDANNNLIYRNEPNRYEQWYEYDSNGNLIHYKYSNGYEEWYEYDDKGNLIHCKYSDGFEKFMKYNTNNELITETSNVYEKYYKYEYV